MKRRDTNPHILSLNLSKNKFFPNSELPVLVYQTAIELPKQKNVAADMIQKIFIKNNWGNSWRNGIYDFHHYHSNTHECLGIASGSAKVILGGPGGRKIIVKQGDVLILPAGVGHKCLSNTKDFLCIGGYPGAKEYDTNLGTAAEFKKAIPRIKKLSIPAKDPVFGKEGFLKAYWKNL
jgi:uncharacterized protein YjlB